jgi:WD40 repeat protein
MGGDPTPDSARTRHDVTVSGPVPYRDTVAKDGEPVTPAPQAPEPTLSEPERPGLLDREATVADPGLPKKSSSTNGNGAHKRTLPEPVPLPVRPAAQCPTFDGYEVLGVLGRGGMGIVYLARQLRLNRLCALKTILIGGHASDEAMARFLAEAEAVARLRHPNIVQIFHIADQDGVPYLELEHVEGGSLAGQLDGTPRPALEAARLVQTLARAMHEAHRQGIIHRDLKPANVLLAADGTPKVTDFGVAKCLDTDGGLTRTDSILGSPSYMAPEQADGRARDVGPAADVYALGAILYELLTGRPPFQGASLLQVLDQVRSVEPVPPTRLVPGLPRDLETICLTCLRKEPARRYASAEWLADDLRRFENGEPILARTIGRAERIRLWIRRHPATAVAVGAAAVLLLTITTGSLIAAVSLKRAADAAERARRETELVLADMHVSHGLVEGGRGRAAEAVLWFANAASVARRDPDRVRADRARARAWLREACVPVSALHEEDPKEVAFRPGGDCLLVLGRAGKLTVWNLESNSAEPFPPSDVTAARWGPDGAWLALARAGGDVEIRNTNDGGLDHRLERRGAVGAVVFSPDGHWLALAGDVVRIWDTRTRSFAAGPWSLPAAAYSATFSPRGDRLAVAMRNGEARVFDLEAKADSWTRPHASQVETQKSLHAPPPEAPPAFVDDGRGLVTITGGREATWWDVRTGEPVRRFAFRGIGDLRRVAASPDGSGLALVGWGGTQWERFGSPSSGDLLKHRHLATDAAFSAEGATLLTVGSDRTARLWSIPDGRALGEPIAHQANVLLGAVSTDGLHFATAQSDGLVRVWRRPAGPAESHRLACDFGNLTVRPGPDGTHAILARYRRFGWDYPARRTRVFQITDGRPAGPFLDLAGPIRDAALAPDGRSAATVCEAPRGAGELRIWDFRTGRSIVPPVALAIVPDALAWDPRGGRVAVIGRGGAVVVVDAASARTLLTFEHSGESDSKEPLDIQFTPDGRSLVTVGPDATVGVWDAANGRPRYERIRPGGARIDAVLSRDVRWLATGGRDGILQVWDLHTGRLQTRALSHPDWIFQVRFSADGRRILTACRDGQVRLWDWEKGTLACPPLSHEDEVWSADLTPDGRWALTASRDYTAQVWELVTGRPVAPRVRLGGQGTSILATPDGRYAVIGSVGSMPLTLSLDDLTEDDPGMAPDDLRRLGELASGQRVVGGNLAGLTSAEWLERWSEFAPSHAAFGASWRASAAPRNRRAATRLLSARRWPEAIAHLSAAALVRDPVARAERGRALTALGRLEEARAELEATAHQAGDDPATWVALGRREAEAGHPDRADTALARAAGLAPEAPQVFLDGGWWVSGPYPEELDKACEPESQPDPSQSTLWRDAPTGPSGLVDLGAALKHTEHISAYAMTYLYARQSRPVRLLVGSDDAVRIWLNGELVHEHPEPRSGAPAQETVAVTLKAGRNVLLAKVTNATGDHLLYLTVDGH